MAGPEQHAIWVVIGIAGAATYVWRAVGVAAAGRIRVDGPLFSWVTYVAYGLLAALVARMIVLPVGEALQGVPLWVRLGCAAVSLAVFFALKRNVAAGVAAGAGALALYATYF